MSNKPAKHSDKNRPWRDSERRSARYVKVQMVRHLIVCEGKQTECRYFNDLKKCLGGSNGRKLDIEVIGTGEHTVDLLEHARALAHRAPDAYSHVWLAYDLDDFSREEFDQVARDSCCPPQSTHARDFLPTMPP